MTTPHLRLLGHPAPQTFAIRFRRVAFLAKHLQVRKVQREVRIIGSSENVIDINSCRLSSRAATLTAPSTLAREHHRTSTTPRFTAIEGIALAFLVSRYKAFRFIGRLAIEKGGVGTEIERKLVLRFHEFLRG